MSNPKQPHPEFPPKRRQLVDDPELAAMNRIARLLDPLDAVTRARVVAWINARWRSDPPAPQTPKDNPS